MSTHISSSLKLNRRKLLTSIAAIALSTKAHAEVYRGKLPFTPNFTTGLDPLIHKGWLFFTPDEARTVEAICERLIPTDDAGPGGKDAGCAVFIDRQLAGPYGSASGLYVQPPFMPGTPGQGYQGADAPAAIYRKALRSLSKYVAGQFNGKTFAELSENDQDDVLKAVESGRAEFDGDIKATAFFGRILNDTKSGYFADPIYGGNRDMASWRMIGFPGARYDYRDWVTRHNERYPLPPVSIAGRSDWNRKEQE